jgi:hypothetical protein
MSDFECEAREALNIPCLKADEVPAMYVPYERLAAAGTPIVEPEHDLYYPAAFAVQPTTAGGLLHTPLYASEIAQALPSLVDESGWIDPMWIDWNDDTDFKEMLWHNIALVATRTTPCCGRLTEVAVARVVLPRAVRTRSHYPMPEVTKDALQTVLHQRFAPHALAKASDAEFAAWGEALFRVLRYNTTPVASSARNPSSRQRRHTLVMWGAGPLRALTANLLLPSVELRPAHRGVVDNGWLSLQVCDLQVADLRWRCAHLGGVAQLAQLPGQNALDDCHLMFEHMLRLAESRDNQLADVQRPHPLGWRLGPPEPFVLATPSALSCRGTRPPAPLPDTSDQPRTPPAFDKPLDRLVRRAERGEQRALKKLLLPGTTGECALCGRTFDSQLLWAAHIKKRSHCTPEERRDLANIAMLACTLGCDTLYEHGYIAVDDGGAVLVSPRARQTPAAIEHIERYLADRIVDWWTRDRADYFAWHRHHTYRADPADELPPVPRIPHLS